VARVDYDDERIDAATETIEIPAPYLNHCGDLLPSEKWASQVMWIIDDEDEGPDPAVAAFAEVGHRRLCTINGPRDLLYAAVGAPLAFPREFTGITPRPGERWTMTIGFDAGTNLWRATVAGPTGTAEQTFAPPSVGGGSFTDGNRLEVGGENVGLFHDMGVSGHLEPVYHLTSGLGPYLFMYEAGILQTDLRSAPRYNLVKGGGGFNGMRFFQTQSDIHRIATPTPGAPANCSDS
jgi:hypothetical protein